ncbi:hypothetical protein S7711_06460 [Stachybotrys chartarum IBT 7711]|uniref:Uncharacterized protein n=1 Tax=Stachybotrys chartarum (strain CBS 109288 / IBT 7711) TaxID=1280523 RepID=A0A084AX95_STACB|nr:hypothetical protein S7711_06460 [Stachybotrys chartarum IBT 7711]KFA49892.1 hypothetical protein S40293_01324 [Stachybotrys chartarum IBT 40293]
MAKRHGISESALERLAETYPSATIVHGLLDDEALVMKEAAAADIVLRKASTYLLETPALRDVEILGNAFRLVYDRALG